MSRAIRRHHRARVIAKRKHYYGGYLSTPKQFGKVAATATPCSCYACGNSRRHWGSVTIQERRFACEDLEEDHDLG